MLFDRFFTFAVLSALDLAQIGESSDLADHVEMRGGVTRRRAEGL